VISPAPEYVVCFIPSDFALSAALDADPELLAYAAHERVVIVGPTNLVSLLWSVGYIVRQHQIAVNAEQIAQIAGQMFERIRKVAEPVAKLSKSIDTVVKDYNTMLGSFESRLIPAAKNLRSLGGGSSAKPLAELRPVGQLPHQLNESQWGVDDENALPEGVSEIIELDEYEDE
jgi:DNA recombination protein RmuC